MRIFIFMLAVVETRLGAENRSRTIRELRDDLSVQSLRSDDCGSMLHAGGKRIVDWSRIVSTMMPSYIVCIVEPHMRRVTLSESVCRLCVGDSGRERSTR